MDFNKLMQTMRELDQPVGETAVPECGEPMGMTPPMGGNMGKPDTPPPSMSVNLNAQGMDNIEQLLKLVTKVNPDMEKPALPALGGMGAAPAIEIEPMDKPAGGMPSLGNLDSGPLKMLPDFDKDNDKMPGGERDGPNTDIDGVDLGQGDDIGKAQGDQDNDGDHDMDDHDMEKEEPADDEEKEEEAYGNSVGGSEPHTMDVDASIPNGDDLHKQKSMHRAAAGGDNPMQRNESGDLRAQIRAELLQRLAEAKGEK